DAGNRFRLLLDVGRGSLNTASYPGMVTKEQLALITSDPQILHGQARVAGTRVTVSVVLDCLAAGMSEAEILAEYPTLTAAGIRAAAAYGAALAREELVPLDPRG
ncbi:MAG TPA: DUF433 domain-containing protein, partial [Acidimicrobiales bacterium]|nr:DUF433 domain-containing protein [Acidimicrobiales bacterium]